MKITELSLQNIGPFKEAHLEFATEGEGKPAVVLITGENGTGKSIIIDAIRTMFGSNYAGIPSRNIIRNMVSDGDNISITMSYSIFNLETEQWESMAQISAIQGNRIIPKETDFKSLYYLPVAVAKRQIDAPNWVVDYWASNVGTGDYNISALKAFEYPLYLSASLKAEKPKNRVTELICYIDYLRDSEDTIEKSTASILYEKLKKIIELSLLAEGSFSHVARTRLEPIIVQNKVGVPLASLSSGNSYLIQNLIELLGKMYAVHLLRKTPLQEIGNTPGLLLIDEAENQLHPKWQKRLIPTILKLFPNLQIIATTHSPFIISSVENAKLFVCKSEGDHCVVEDVSGKYNNKPVDEILASPLFDETLPFNETISRLMEEREQAIENGDEVTRLAKEKALKALNPQYFSYFDIRNLLKEVVGEN